MRNLEVLKKMSPNHLAAFMVYSITTPYYNKNDPWEIAGLKDVWYTTVTESKYSSREEAMKDVIKWLKNPANNS